MPARREVAESEAYRQKIGPELADAYLASIASATQAPWSQAVTNENSWLNYPFIWLYGAYDKIIQDGQTVEEALESAQQLADDYRACVIAAEAFDSAGRVFDHILLLRSWNHLVDPALVIDRLLDALRLGGIVTIVDNVAFGLVRSHARAESAERSEAALEHYRNDGASQALERLAGLPVEVVEQVDVGPLTSNQWLLRLRRVP